MTWDYAELSKAAKAFGGPEKLVEHIVDVSKRAGRFEMIPAVGGALVVGSAVGFAVTKIITYFQAKKNATYAELEDTKAEIIDGIKAYDASHPEETNCVETQDQAIEGVTDN